MADIQRRIDAVNATREHFEGRPFSWGTTDCAKVAVFHLRQLGKVPPFGLAKAGPYKTALGAKRALKRAGHASLAAALDSVGLPRIAPAYSLPGDLVINPGADGWEALAVYAGNGAILTFHEHAECLAMVRVADPNNMQVWRAEWPKH
ncbi:hypothetical protein SAMN06297144_3446 [Sphingomonas guangdongensis]|uniref:DUF6950 domain-containing protein n=1 Tax=Sphingomonas guangdongensis TaxID=1141890 RepID=A0A285R2H0_9SPHN|nr:hypothetical protein [Sphingomonas guangdongensis]SOB88295.1 hypothetical protein SAMN06297144_3446 [Sphingomonas guangdongensis]